MKTVTVIDNGRRLRDYFFAPTRTRFEILYEADDPAAKDVSGLDQHDIEIYGSAVPFDHYNNILKKNVYSALLIDAYERRVTIKRESLVMVYMYHERFKFFANKWVQTRPRCQYEGPLRKKHVIHSNELVAATITSPRLA